MFLLTLNVRARERSWRQVLVVVRAFCPFSRSQIAGQANGHSSCLIDTATPAPTFQDCPVTPLSGSSANGSLGPSDCRSPSRGVEHFADRYSFNGNAGQRVTITMNTSSGGLDPYIYLIGPDGYVVAQDDDGNGGVNSRIPFGTATFTLPDTGTYIVEATSFARAQTGSYTISVNQTGCTISATPRKLTSRRVRATGRSYVAQQL